MFRILNMKTLDNKKIIDSNTPPKIYKPEDIQIFVEQNIQKYTDEKLKNLENRFEERIEKKETKTTEVLAIFITLFTFISANITIFTKVSDIKRAVFFMVLMTLCSITLLSFTFISINEQKKNIFQWIALLASLGLMIIILFCLYNIRAWKIPI